LRTNQDMSYLFYVGYNLLKCVLYNTCEMQKFLTNTKYYPSTVMFKYDYFPLNRNLVFFCKYKMSPIAENLRTRARSTEEQKFKKLVLNEHISRESQAVKAKTIWIFNRSKTSVEFLKNAAPFP
jgi:hypothetical protein